MRKQRLLSVTALAAAVAVSGAVLAPAIAAGVSKSVAAAVGDTSRPADDTKRDADRKPGATLAFAGVKPGDKVVDFIAGGGYFTRLFADVVGAKGHVYAVEPSEVSKFPSVAKAITALQAYAADKPNVTVTVAPAVDALKFPEKVDVFWISQNYHDLKDKFMGPVDTMAFNKAVYAALKPGGTYIVLDHAAVKGAPMSVTEDLHRIDPAVVRREVEAAGFKFEGESHILANSADPHTANVFDKTIRGHTDQFIFKFRKPRK
jgi:predicted methyltransferase